MKLIAILATLAVASASAQQECSGPANIPTDDPVAAQTAMCLLSIDNRLLVNERCNVLFLPDGREVALDAGKHYTRVSSHPRPPRYTHSSRELEPRKRSQRPAHTTWVRHSV